MKRLIALFCLLFAANAFAADNPVACSGASCKIVLEPRDSGSNKVTTATVESSVPNTSTMNVGRTGTAEVGTSIFRIHGGSSGGGTGRSSALMIDPGSRGLDFMTWNDYKFYLNGNTSAPLTSTVTITNASPAVLTTPAVHGLTVGDRVFLQTNGTLPTGLAANGTLYFVIAAGFTTTSFEVSTTFGGAAINTSSAGSGTHTFVTSTNGGQLGMSLSTNGLVVDLGASKAITTAVSLTASLAGAYTSTSDIVPYYVNNISPSDTTTTVRAQYAGQWNTGNIWGIGVDGTTTPSVAIGSVAPSTGKMAGTAFIKTNSTRTLLNGIFTGEAAIAIGGNCTTSTCTIDADPLGMLSSVTRSSTGTYAIVFTGSFWSSGPTCVVTSTNGGNQYCQMNINALSVSSYQINCFTANTAAAVDSRFMVMCQGPRN